MQATWTNADPPARMAVIATAATLADARADFLHQISQIVDDEGHPRMPALISTQTHADGVTIEGVF